MTRICRASDLLVSKKYIMQVLLQGHIIVLDESNNLWQLIIFAPLTATLVEINRWQMLKKFCKTSIRASIQKPKIEIHTQLPFGTMNIKDIQSTKIWVSKSNTLIAENIGGVCIISPTNLSFTVWMSASDMCSQDFLSIIYYKTKHQVSIATREND